MWYKFTAYNSETLYGWTMIPDVAEAALAHLNAKREINVYAMEELSDSNDEDGGTSFPLRDRQSLIFTDDTSLADYDPENW